MEFIDYLKTMVSQEASDLYLSTAAPPSIKVHGTLTPIDPAALPAGRVKEIAYQVMDAEQRIAFEKKPEINLAISESGVGRFRVNVFKQRGQVSMVVRHIKTEIPSTESLGLPPILKELIQSKCGLILFVGATGSGKSTSLASLIDYRNTHSAGHIISIEDPIEFVHPHKRSIVNQREVGVDTDCYEDALANTLRQAPDVILIGEIRHRETMEHAIAFAETGHLCLSTLHANNANQALDRIINFFPDDRRNQLLLDLSLNLRAFVSQRLIPNHRRQARRRRGDPHRHTAGSGANPPWGHRQHQGGDGEVRDPRHADLRQRVAQAAPGRKDQPGRGPSQCRLPQQPAHQDQPCRRQTTGGTRKRSQSGGGRAGRG